MKFNIEDIRRELTGKILGPSLNILRSDILDGTGFELLFSNDIGVIVFVNDFLYDDISVLLSAIFGCRFGLFT